MTRGKKLAAIIGGVVVGLVCLVVVAGIIVVQTDWFRNLVRQKIVTSVEDATGGQVEIASFRFDWRHLTARITGFKIHGLEGPDAAPLLSAALVQVNLRPSSDFISYLLVDTPRANVIVYPDGHTNIPAPKVPPKHNDKTGVETIVDLAIGRFELRNGSVTLANRKTDLNASGANLRTNLNYNQLSASYGGEIDVAPLYVATGGRAPLDVDVRLPIDVEKDKLTLSNASFRTPRSQILVSGSMDHLVAPHTSAHVNAKLALAEVPQLLGKALPFDAAHGPEFLTADIAGSMDDQNIDVQSAHATLGQSDIEASGRLKESNRAGSLRFRSTLALGELGRLLRVQSHPEGVVRVGGNAALDRNNDYRVNANVEARDVAVQQGTTRIAGVSLDSAVSADPRRIELDGLRLSALGGSFAGKAGIENMSEYHLSGDLHGFEIAQLTRTFAPSVSGYAGNISGPVQAAGNLNDSASLAAKANLAITPEARGIPVSGHLGVNYDGRAGLIELDHSRVALPHTVADLSGSLGQQVHVRVVSRDMADLKPIAAIPVSFSNGGSATIDANVRGNLKAPEVAAQANVTDFAVEGRAFTRLAATLNATPASASVPSAVLTHGPLQAQFTLAVGLHNWKPEKYEPLKLDLVVRNADLRDVMALAGQANAPMSGAFQADAHVNGTVGSPTGNASFRVDRGTLEGEPFDTLTANANMNPTEIDVPSFSLVAGASRVDLTAAYRHAVNDLDRGTLTAHVASNQVQLAQFQSLVKDRPGLQGVLNLTADIAANMTPSPRGVQTQLTAVNGSASARNLAMQGKALGDFQATATTAGPKLRYTVNSNFAGSTIRVDGTSLLTGDHQTSATANIANLPIDSVLAVAGRTDVPVRGTLSANARVSGTLDRPNANGTFSIANGSVYQEPFTRLQASVNYTDVLVDVPQLQIAEGPSQVELSASFRHPAGDLQDGEVQFRARGNAQLGRVHAVSVGRPGLDGRVDLTADGAATLRRNATAILSSLNAHISAQNLSMNRQPLGGVNATATTQGRAVAFTLNSDLAKARIEGSGRLDLANGNPIDARLSFNNVTWSGLRPLLGSSAPFDAALDGQANVAGPIARPEAMRGSVQLTRLQARAVPKGGAKAPRVNFEIHNQGPIQVSLANSVVTVQHFQLAGPSANLSFSGAAPLDGKGAMNLKASGNIQLEALEAFNDEIVSAGAVNLSATATGTPSLPVVHGALQLQDASFNMLSLPNGFTHATGNINFNGTEAVLDNVTGQVGGGKVTLAGYFGYGGPQTQFHLQATATRVHIDYPEGVTTEANALVTLAGTAEKSLVSGNVTILNVGMHSHTDIGSVLTSAATPPPAATATTGLAAGIHFDVRVRTSPGAQFRTTLTQNLQADADLTLRGTPDRPGALGRVVVNSGEVVFFGAKYHVDQGTLAFYDPNKINPVLNVDLETTVQGVDVSLSVSGPMDKLKLSYHSDPPLEFQQIISLLTSGKTPTTDPVLAAHQPPTQQQNFEQAGASAILSQAVANPVSGRLQRLFGVTKLSIDPQIVGSTSNNPQATLTLQQQITKEITFTYIQDVSQSTPDAIRIEWAITPRFSAVAQRDIFGEFALDFFYKKRFH